MPSAGGGGLASASLELRSLDETFLNPILAPLRRGLIERARISGSLDVSTDLPIDPTGLPRRVEGALSIEQLDYRTLRISGARLTVDATPRKLTAELAPTRINQGRLSARASRARSGDGERVEAAVQTSALDLGALSRAFREDLPATVQGILDLSASLSSEAPPGAGLLGTANGSVRVKLARGRIRGFDLMSFLAAQSGIEAFGAIPLDDFAVDTDVAIADGVAHLEEAEVRSAAAALLVNGTVALQGFLDLTVEAFAGPSVSGALERVGIRLEPVQKLERLAAVPVALRVSGPFEDPSYRPAAPRTVERTGEALGTGGGRVDRALRGVTDLFRKRK